MFHLTGVGECENAFKELERALTEAPILNYPIEDGDFVIDTDASNVGVGGVFSQIQNGQETVISYFSRCLSKCERRYCGTRKELLAVVATVKQFHHYLLFIYLYGRIPVQLYRVIWSAPVDYEF